MFHTEYENNLLERLRGQNFNYHLEKYCAGHSELTVQAFHPDRPETVFRLTFETTVFVQLPSHWEGKDFVLAPTSRKDELLSVLGHKDDLREIMSLFTTEPASQPEILILCRKVFYSEEIKFFKTRATP